MANMDDDVKHSFKFFDLVVAECFYVSRNLFQDFVGSEEYFVNEISQEKFYPN